MPGSHVHGNLTFYRVHGTSCIVGMCAAGISTTIISKVYLLGKTETDSCINSIQAIPYINIHGRFAVIGWYTRSIINNRPVITALMILFNG